MGRDCHPDTMPGRNDSAAHLLDHRYFRSALDCFQSPGSERPPSLHLQLFILHLSFLYAFFQARLTGPNCSMRVSNHPFLAAAALRAMATPLEVPGSQGMTGENQPRSNDRHRSGGAAIVATSKRDRVPEANENTGSHGPLPNPAKSEYIQFPAQPS